MPSRYISPALLKRLHILDEPFSCPTTQIVLATIVHSCYDLESFRGEPSLKRPEYGFM